MRTKPTEAQILMIKDYKDDSFNEAMTHAESLLDFKTEREKRDDKYWKEVKRSKHKR